MASFRTLAIQFNSLINIKPACRININERFYSVFPKEYVQPIFDKNTQKILEESGEIKEITHLPIKPVFGPHTSSEFYNEALNKFINYLTKGGNKKGARSLVTQTFENVKRAQIRCYNKTKDPEKQKEIEVDPIKVFHKAVENATPVLELLKMKRGGITYQVPVPLTAKRSRFLAMKWLIEAGNNKERTTRLPEKLAQEIIDASLNKGRVIRKKQELYRQCEANRSYAHFRWT